MRTLIISDLHLGNGGIYDTFAGVETLPALLSWFCQRPGRVIVAGDVVDFLLNEDPLQLDVARAVQQARDIVVAPVTALVLRAFGAALAAGCEVSWRLGNHDVELALPEVQEVFRASLGQPDGVAAQLRFELGTAPALIEVGGAPLLITHGEHRDAWNRVDYDRLLAPDARDDFRYPPGSKLVKTILNPLKREYRMRFADLLKPDFTGAVMTALAVNPLAVREIFKGSTLSLMAQLMSRMGGPLPFAAGEEDTGLGARVAAMDLDAAEVDALLALADDAGPMAFADPGADLSVRRKLLRSGLALYATAHRAVAGPSGERFFELAPTEAEWTEARRLATKHGAVAVVLGHSHAARFRAEPGLAYVNTGTWIGLMGLPDDEASDAEWERFLTTLRANPSMDPALGAVPDMRNRFTGALVEPTPDGATLSLIEWRDGAPVVHAAASLSRSP